MEEKKWYQILGERFYLRSYCKQCRQYKWFHYKCLGHNGKTIANAFFAWIETYHPLQKFWELGNAQGGPNDENYPYSYFKVIAKKKLAELIDQ